MADINIIEKLQKLMITTPEEDKQYLNEIIDELQQSKKPRGRPRTHNKENGDIIKENEDIIKEDIIRENKPKGRPKIFTEEEKRIRNLACDKRRYDADPQKKIQMNRDYRSRIKELKNKIL